MPSRRETPVSIRRANARLSGGAGGQEPACPRRAQVTQSPGESFEKWAKRGSNLSSLPRRISRSPILAAHNPAQFPPTSSMWSIPGSRSPRTTAAVSGQSLTAASWRHDVRWRSVGFLQRWIRDCFLFFWDQWWFFVEPFDTLDPVHRRLECWWTGQWHRRHPFERRSLEFVLARFWGRFLLV